MEHNLPYGSHTFELNPNIGDHRHNLEMGSTSFTPYDGSLLSDASIIKLETLAYKGIKFTYKDKTYTADTIIRMINSSDDDLK